jgi:hypothetical protein
VVGVGVVPANNVDTLPTVIVPVLTKSCLSQPNPACPSLIPPGRLADSLHRDPLWIGGVDGEGSLEPVQIGQELLDVVSFPATLGERRDPCRGCHAADHCGSRPARPRSLSCVGASPGIGTAGLLAP